MLITDMYFIQPVMNIMACIPNANMIINIYKQAKTS